MTNAEYYNSLELGLTHLQSDLASILVGSRFQDQIREFISVGEYGLALETIVSELIEGGHTIPQHVFDRITSLAKTMQIGSDKWKAIKRGV